MEILPKKPELVLILDYGSQYTHLITRRIRGLSLVSLCLSGASSIDQIAALAPRVIILSGGPHSVHSPGAPSFPSGFEQYVHSNGVFVLGICYGLQLMVHSFGGLVRAGDKQDFGRMELAVQKDQISDLFSSTSDDNGDVDGMVVWTSHGDEIVQLPEGFLVVARSRQGSVAAVEDRRRRFYGLQFHPEVSHSSKGMELLRHFLYDVCGLSAGQKMEPVMDEEINIVKDLVGPDSHVICAPSGGVDSTVATTLVNKAIGDRLHSVFVDNDLHRDAPQLLSALKEMKGGLDTVRSKVQALTTKVKEGQLPTSDGMSYLDAKYLLLLTYCQSLVYYMLRKAKGLSIQGHPLIHSIVEIRLFLEKIRLIDKKNQYQIQKLARAAERAAEKAYLGEQGKETEGAEDLLKYRPNPDMLRSKKDVLPEDGHGVYRPLKFAPTLMEEEKSSRQERNAMRREAESFRRVSQSDYMREMVDDIEGRPQEVRETIGAESRELKKYMSKLDHRAQQEEELFTRVPISKKEKNLAKHLKKSRNGLMGLTDNLYDDIKFLPVLDGETSSKKTTPPEIHSGFKSRKRKSRRGGF